MSALFDDPCAGVEVVALVRSTVEEEGVLAGDAACATLWCQRLPIGAVAESHLCRSSATLAPAPP
jgi:hypothetical protein